jgi:membrane associated rhomboid family serine protease
MRTPPMSFALPPFGGAVKWLIFINAGIFILQLIVARMDPVLYATIMDVFALIPRDVAHGFAWQLFTYAFLHGGLGHLFFNMLSIWFIGSRLEERWGTRQFVEFYLFCVFGAAVSSIAIAYMGILGLSPDVATIGASGGFYGLLMAFGYLYSEAEMFMFPLPFMVKAKYIVGIAVFVAFASALGGGGNVAYVAHLGGLLFGFLYVRFLPRRGLSAGLSEAYYGTRNRYYRWKRRRAARKFEVYMRNVDRSQYFDEYGNFREPTEDEKNSDNGESKWVN